MAQGRSRLGAIVCVLLLFMTNARALENNLARTPPMGWLAWERFTCEVDCRLYPNDCVSAKLFKQMSDRLFEDGWLEAGYQYMHIDDCWSELERDPQTQRLVADRKRFPANESDSIRELANYVHKYDGLKLGLYGDCGPRTCAGYPAQLKSVENRALDGHDYQTATYFKLDAETLKDWQVDSLKFDGCHIDAMKAERICPKMALALAETKRPILLICEWPFYMMYAHAEPDFDLAASSCNVWRYYDDIEDSWLSVLNTIDHTVRHESTIVKYHGPGHWFDPDQLVIGNFGLSVAQARAQMALWCIWSAPLYMSNDLRSIRREFVEILQNKHLIAIDQDKLGVLGMMVKEHSDAAGQLQQAFVKPILPIRNKCPSFAVVYLNRATLGSKQKVSFKLADLLAGAPIRQAAKNQAIVEQFEAANRKPTAAAHLTDGEELDQLLFGSDPQQRQADRIEPGECLRRLKQLAQDEPQPSGQARSKAVEFELFDLFDGGRSLGLLRLNESLELLVEPSSVRAIRLIEK